MPNYLNGKIYKIISENTEKIYIGSTVKKLSCRFSDHKRNPLHKISCASNIIIECGEARIELIEEYPCESKKDLLLREQYWMDHFSDLCVNKQRAIVDKKLANKEWRENNKEYLKEKYKDYYQLHKGETLKRNRERIECDLCGKNIAYSTLKTHMDNIHNQIKIKCEKCGQMLKKNCIRRHRIVCKK